MEQILFYIFSSLAVVSALMVIRAENPVHSVLFLVLVFFNSAGLLLLLEVEFLAMLFIVVYVGAIAVLFLFVVMMLNVKMAKHSNDLLRYLPVGGLVIFVFLMEIFLLVEGDLVSPLSTLESGVQITQWFSLVDRVTNIEIIGQIMYTYYFFFFLAASIILLVAMIGAIVLTLQVQYNVKRQQIFQQVSRDFERAVFLTSRTKD